MADLKLTDTTRDIVGDDAAWKREKNEQIRELQNAIKVLTAQQGSNRR